MKLRNFIEHISYESIQGSQEAEITDICYYSGKVKHGALFVCLKGQFLDGHDYIIQAVECGAVAIVIHDSYVVHRSEMRDSMIISNRMRIGIRELTEEKQVTVIVTEDTHRCLAELSEVFFDYPASKLKMIGITGTKGKTTTAFLTAAILREAGYKTGLVGTVHIDDGENVIASVNTTPESADLQRYLAQMVINGCDCCVMEVSSQGQMMQRTHGIFFEIGVFLNIEPDHIGEGEHQSFDEYLHWKSTLLQQCRIGIVNRDDPRMGQILNGHTCQVETFSRKHPADVSSSQERFAMEQGMLMSHFDVTLKETGFSIALGLPGGYNIYNALAAILISSHFHVSTEQMVQALKTCKVPGRSELIHISDEYAVLIDYAHNEMSLRNLLSTLREYHPLRLVVIFGCGGNRSTLRRYQMGEAAGHLADFTIITSDNPRWENPEEILSEIEAGIKDTQGSYIRISDRGAAVRYAIEHAMRGDIIVLAGKGHEMYQEIKGTKYPMDEYSLLWEALT